MQPSNLRVHWEFMNEQVHCYSMNILEQFIPYSTYENGMHNLYCTFNNVGSFQITFGSPVHSKYWALQMTFGHFFLPRTSEREREKTSCLLPISEHKIHLIFRHWFTQKLKMIRTISIIDVVFNCEIELESSLWNWVVKIHYHSIWTIESMKSSKLISKILSKMEIHNTKLNRIMHIREDSQIVI